MVKVDIISGFLGAGKTTLIKKLLSEALNGKQVAVIENEFGQIGIDSGFLRESGIKVREMSSGCICCSLVGDFGEALKEVADTYDCERIIIEPSGVGKLSDVIAAVENNTDNTTMELASYCAVIDASKCRMYMKNFGEFYNNQIEYAGTIILSRTQGMNNERLDEVISMIKAINPAANIISTSWDNIDGSKLLDIMEEKHSRMSDYIEAAMEEAKKHAHHHHDHDHEAHDHDKECHGHEEHDHEGHCYHHVHDEECHEHHHQNHDSCCGHEEHEHGHCCDHHHDHDHEHEHHHDNCHHEHHHDHDECCGHHEHHHHDADEVFTSWGKETAHKYEKSEIDSILARMEEGSYYGTVLRAKGILECTDGWIEFDLVPEEIQVRSCSPDVTGRLCVIGTDLNTDKIEEDFKVRSAS